MDDSRAHARNMLAFAYLQLIIKPCGLPLTCCTWSRHGTARLGPQRCRDLEHVRACSGRPGACARGRVRVRGRHHRTFSEHPVGHVGFHPPPVSAAALKYYILIDHREEEDFK